MSDLLDQVSAFWKPHPGQAKFLLSNAKTKILACGRRWGKSQALAIQILYRMLSHPFSKQILVAPTIEQSKISLESAAEFGSKLGIPIESNMGKLPFLAFEGSKVMARSAKQGNNLRGFEATDIIIDEAAFVPDSFIERVLMPMMAITDG